jgi:hypothetical protein
MERVSHAADRLPRGILFFARALIGVILFFAPALLGRSEWDRVLTSEPVGGILILGLTEPTPGENNI